ncbi:unnamed protein product, partial [Rotaria sp. Silwood2]
MVISTASSPTILIRRSNSDTIIGKRDRRHRVPAQEIVQNYLLIWLDEKIDRSTDDFRNSIRQLRRTVNTIEVFHDTDECIGYMSQLQNENSFLIIAGSLCESVVPRIHNMTQLYSIYVLCQKKAKYEEWAKNWSKVKDIFVEIDSICESVRQTARECDEDSIVISNQIEPSFMYTQLFKEIILEIDFDEQKEINDLVEYAGKKYADNEKELKVIDEFAQKYQGHLGGNNQPISWYTRECFMYHMVNKALCTLQVETLLKMGMFIRDLHQNIQKLHSEQFYQIQNDSSITTLIVYRGKTMMEEDFKEKIKQGVLMSFNNFLSTSEERNVAMGFISKGLKKSTPDNNKIGVLFKMKIDRSISSASFARIDDISHFETEKEVLFSTHTVFRIQHITEIRMMDTDAKKIWQVELTLTNGSDDEQLSALTEKIREEITGTGWQTMGCLLWKLGANDKAEEVYKMLLAQASNQSDKAYCYNELGLIKTDQGDYQNAVEFLKKTLDIYEQTLTPNHPDLATSYNNIGWVYNNMGEYSKALSSYERSLEIRKIALPPTHSDFAQSYNNIGLVYNNMGEYSKALEFHEKAYKIREKTLPPSHPDLATSLDNIGGVYSNRGEYSKALSSYERSLEIRKIALPPTHSDSAQSYNNIGLVHNNMGEYSKALEFYEKSHQIYEKALSPNHPDFATVFSNIGLVHNNMGEYSKALEFYEKSHQIYEKALPPNHPHLATVFSNIGLVHNNMGEYSKALEFYEKSHQIYEKALPPNYLDLASSFSNIGQMYQNLGEYSKALEFYEKAYKIREKTLPPSHSDLAVSRLNFAACYEKMGDYSETLEALQTALQIQEKVFEEGNQAFTSTYSLFGRVYRNMKEYSKALDYFQKCLAIEQKTLPAKHPHLALTYSNIGDVHRLEGCYEMALLFHQKALNIQENSRCNPLDCATTYVNLGETYREMKDYTTAMTYYQKGMEIREKKLGKNHPDLDIIYHNLAKLYLITQQYSMAMKNVQQAIKIGEEKLPGNHPHLVDYRETLEKIRK